MSIISVFEKFHKQILLEAHPVGSIYTSFNNTDPSKLFGGVWSQLPEGYFLRTVERASRIGPKQFGGADTFSLTEDNIPSLGVMFDTTFKGGKNNSVGLGTSSTPSENVGYILPDGLTYANGNPTSRTSTLSANLNRATGGWKSTGDPVSNVPAHITVYMWERIG